MDLWCCNGPKNGKFKGFKYNAMVEEFITVDNRQKLIKGESINIKIKEIRFVFDKMNKITVNKIEKKF